MKNIIKRLMVVICLLGLTSCASLVTRSTKTVYIKSNKEVKVLYGGEFVGQGRFVPFQASNRPDQRVVTVIDIETDTERVFVLQYGFNADVLNNGAWFCFPVVGWIGLAGLALDLKKDNYITLEEVDYYIEWKKEVRHDWSK